MAIKVKLINSSFGSLTVYDAVGLNELTKTVKRSEEFEGVIFAFTLDFEFIKKGRRFIKKCYEQAGGVDALVVVYIYEYDPNNYIWELYGTGQINFNRYELSEVSVIVAIEQTGIDRRVLNMLNQPVDLQTILSENGTVLPAQNYLDSTWHSKSILKESLLKPSLDAEYQQLDAGSIGPLAATVLPNDVRRARIWYGTFDFSDVKSEEVPKTFATSNEFVVWPFVNDVIDGAGTDEKYIDFLSDPQFSDEGDPVKINQIDFEEGGVGDVELTIRSKSKIVATNTGGDIDVPPGNDKHIGACEVYAWVECRSASGVIKFIEKIGSWTMVISGLSLAESDYETKVYNKAAEAFAVGDELFIYTTYRVWGDYEQPQIPDGAGTVHHDLYMQMDKEVSFLRVKQRTVTPASIVRAVFIYESFERCLQFYTNKTVCFYSTLLGRIENGYDQDGEGALTVINSGNWIRGKYDWENNTEHRKLILPLQLLIDFVNSLYCTGFGFETVRGDGTLIGTGPTGMTPGTKVFRLEKRSHFYRKEKSLVLGKVYNIRMKVDNKRYYNLFEHGYSGKLDIKLQNAVDEFNTLRKSRVPVVNTNQELKVATSVRTSGYQIEVQRRLVTSKEDSNRDDDIFAVSMIREDDTFRPKRDDGYAEILNVLEPETGYNYDFSPGRIRKNWYKVLAACLFRHAVKSLYFASGEVNYRMYTRKVDEVVGVSEDGNDNLSGVVPDYVPEQYVLEKVKFTRQQVKLMELNPYGYMELEDQFGKKFFGFIDNSAGVEVTPETKQAELILLRVNEPPEE